RFQRLDAALRAISARFFLESLAARALPPRLPRSAAALRTGSFSCSSPVAILMTLTAAPITSAGRFSPRGPLGIRYLLNMRPPRTKRLRGWYFGNLLITFRDLQKEAFYFRIVNPHGKHAGVLSALQPMLGAERHDNAPDCLPLSIGEPT